MDIWASYERLSPRPDGNYDPGMLRQAEDCDLIATRNGGRVAPHLRYADRDASAYSTKPRPAFERLMAALRAREVERFAVQHADRLYRKPIELENLIELAISRGVLFATTDKLYNLADPEDRLQARIMVAVAAKSSDDTGRRIRRMHEAKAKDGVPVGTRPFGYESDKLTPHLVEAPLILDAVGRLLAGETTYAIAQGWNEAEVRTARGNTWSAFTVKQLLINPRYCGLRTQRRRVVGTATWRPLFDVETHERLVAILTDPRRRTNTRLTNERIYLLSGGLLVCGREGCGKPLRPQPQQGGRTYHCSRDRGGCGAIRIRADRLEAAVEEEVLVGIGLMPGLDAAMQAIEHSAAAAKSVPTESLASLEGRLIALAERMGEVEGTPDAWTEAEYLARRRPLLRKIEQAKAALVGSSPLAVDLARLLPRGVDAWPTMTVDERHLVIKMLVDHVVVTPATHRGVRTVDGRYQINWRDAGLAEHVG